MQMIQSTAWRIARQASIKGFRPRRLYDPNISIRMGSFYLASLLSMFDGQLAPAIAAYHAGERTVGRWLKTRGELPVDEFIESIPYESTRRYVKKVLGSYGLYRLLYNDVDQALGIELAKGAIQPSVKVVENTIP
jgi:soluble lytic murein transglycosylase